MNIRKSIAAGLFALALSTGAAAFHGGILPSALAAEARISLDDAKQIALNHAGFQEDEVTFIKTETDREHGIMVYKIKFSSKDFKYEYDIDMQTGEILEYSGKKL